MKVPGRRERGGPKRRWLDKVKDDIKEKRLSADEVYYDRATCIEAYAIVHRPPHINGNKMKGRRNCRPICLSCYENSLNVNFNFQLYIGLQM